MNECGTKKPLAVAARHFYYKPYIALFRALELQAYSVSIKGLMPGPILDIGCGDGQYAAALCELFELKSALTGLDANPNAIRLARLFNNDVYDKLVVGDLVSMSFRDGQFCAIVCNGVLEAIQGDLAAALREMSRVMCPGGVLFCTVPSDTFGQASWWSVAFSRLKLHGMASWYRQRLNRRMTNFNCYPASKWCALLSDAGFEVVSCEGFFSPVAERVWSLLSWTPLRLLSLTRLVRRGVLRRCMERLTHTLIRRTFWGTPAKLPPDECGYIYLEAVKR